MAAAIFLAAVVYLVAVTRRWIAAQLSESSQPDHIQLAVRLEPNNAEYHKILGRLLETRNQAREVAEQYAIAADLNPYDAQIWLALARSSLAINDRQLEQRALENAVNADPTTPRVAWEAANLYLATNDTERALPLFRVVLENEPGEAYRVFQLCSHVADVETMMRKLLPADPDAYLSLIEFLKSAKDLNGAANVWAGLMRLGKNFEAPRALAFVDFLISQRQVNAARATWLDTVRMGGLSNRISSSDNLVGNAHFEAEILNSGFDWRYRQQANVEVELDGTNFHRGPRSLSINFDGPGINDAGIAQYIAVEPDREYAFSAYFKTGAMDGAGGPRFAIQDAYSGDNLFLSDELKNAEDWRQVNGEFKTSAEMQMAVLTIVRVPAGSPIRGKMWVDDFFLRKKVERQ